MYVLVCVMWCHCHVIVSSPPSVCRGRRFETSSSRPPARPPTFTALFSPPAWSLSIIHTPYIWPSDTHTHIYINNTAKLNTRRTIITITASLHQPTTAVVRLLTPWPTSCYWRWRQTPAPGTPTTRPAPHCHRHLWWNHNIFIQNLDLHSLWNNYMSRPGIVFRVRLLYGHSYSFLLCSGVFHRIVQDLLHLQFTPGLGMDSP